jgi:hypothetical protein
MSWTEFFVFGHQVAEKLQKRRSSEYGASTFEGL